MFPEFTEKEKQLDERFINIHSVKCKYDKPKFYYKINHWSCIGWGVSVVCDSCGLEKDITDVGSW